MALVRSCKFRRYVFAVQYDGSTTLGFTYQKEQENQMNPMGTDLRGVYSVEGRIRIALCNLLSSSQEFENIQVSSRTDRGVHALKNTFHVDLSTSRQLWNPQHLVRGINFHLIRNAKNDIKRYMNDDKERIIPISMYKMNYGDDVRITNCRFAPEDLLPNKHFSQGSDQPLHISWNARFTATSRTYLYRILWIHQPHDGDSVVEDYGSPFEVGRSWKIVSQTLEIDAMRKAATVMTGTHDFSSFRGKGCYRSNPVTSIESIDVRCIPLLSSYFLYGNHEVVGENNNSLLVTVAIKGNAFLYRQVRNMIGCLVMVGKGKMSVDQVKDCINARDRSKAPGMAPAHGLYLANVDHGSFFI